MKRYFWLSSLVICVTAFLACGCSKENNEVEKAPDEGLKVITVGAPTIENNTAGTTRMSFNYSSGLVMAWEADDAIQISGYDNTPTRKKSTSYKASSSGTTSEFTVIPDENFSTIATTYYQYSLGYFANKTNATPKTDIGYTKESYLGTNDPSSWKSAFKIDATQTQTGNNGTSHLKNNYMCVLQSITSGITAPVFSSTWAANHGGEFYQSSCLRLDLTLPKTSDYVGISKILIQTRNESKETEAIIYRNFSKTEGPISALTLNMEDLGAMDFSTTNQNVIAYIMLSAAGIELTADHYIQVRVYFSKDSSNNTTTNYWYRDVKIHDTISLSNGKLGVIKLNSTGWAIK